MSQYLIENVTADGTLVPSLVASDGTVSHHREILKSDLLDLGLNMWRASPGTYNYEGHPKGETFVVISGEADIRINGAETHHLTAGSVVSLPPNTPSEMIVQALLHKVSLNMTKG